MSEARFVGRFAVTDTSRRVSDAAGMQHILTAHGENMTAEREGPDLKIFQHVDEHGLPARKFANEEGTSGIRSTAGVGDAINPRAPVHHAEAEGAPKTVAQLRALHDAHFEAQRNSGRRDDSEVHIHL